MVVLASGGCARESPAPTLHGLSPPVLKPSGEEFRFWRCETAFTRTYHVDGTSSRASDENPGTPELPFKTIDRAAAIVAPGERVVVHAGIYRECIRPMRGGTSPGLMVAFLAEGDVIVRGSDVVRSGWTPRGDGVWALDLRTVAFGAEDPFDLENIPEASFELMSWAEELRAKPPATLPRGMVFLEGRRLQRVATRDELSRTPGSHWTDREARELLVHLDAGTDPNTASLEITTRGSCFRPRTRGLGFIHVRGFVFEHVGNGFPRPQEGAVSVAGGHHWLIEDNTIRQVNGIGIDIGDGWYGGSVRPSEGGRDRSGWNIVRRNVVSQTGVCGIAGNPARDALIEENVLSGNTLYAIEKLYECAAIKTHRNHGTLIRGNLVTDGAVNGIWMDWDNRDSRCTRNVVVNCRTGIYLEASVVDPVCLIDRNVVWGAQEGILEQDSANQRFLHNLVGHSVAGIVLRGRVSRRLVSTWPWRRTTGGGHTVANNAFVEVSAPIERTPGPTPDILAGNALDGLAAAMDVPGRVMTLQATRPLGDFCPQCLVTEDFSDRTWPPEIRSPGPFPLGDQAVLELPLDW
jgi:hypothetical protein